MNRDLSELLQSGLSGSRLVRALAEGIKPVMSAITKPRPLEKVNHFLNGTWLTHPLHPLLTDVPVGAWTGVTLLYLVALIFRVPGLGPAIGLVNALGILAALAAVF